MAQGFNHEQAERLAMAEQHTRQVAVLLASENWPAARRALDRSIAEMQRNPILGPIDEISVEILNLPERYLELLRETLYCETIGDVRKRVRDIQRVSGTTNIGPKFIEELFAAIIDLADRRGSFADNQGG